jgi:hypothetical protein
MVRKHILNNLLKTFLYGNNKIILKESKIYLLNFLQQLVAITTIYNMEISAPKQRY